ncbi:EAL domain-containing protein [Arcobacter sp. FWKO B]|nr:EAL domain-containing protein [Arcobacter sp. FWKO B]
MFIAFLTFLIYHLVSINDKIRNYSNFQTTINELKILDSEFDNLLSNKATFINYDSVTKKVDLFYSKLDNISSNKLYNEFGHYLEYITNTLNHQWFEKHQHIERFKSHNASIVGSLNYLIELTKTVKNRYLYNEYEDIYLLDGIINNLFKLFINVDLDEDTAITDRINLEMLQNKYLSPEFHFLYLRYNSTIQDTARLIQIKEEFSSVDIKTTLEELENLINLTYNSNINSQKNMAFIFFIISSILLIVLISSYLKSLKIKKELSAFRYAVENSDNSIVITDKNRNITYANEAFENITGYKREEIMGKNPSILKSGKMPSEFYNNMNNILNKGEKWHGEFINVNKNGEVYYETASITPIMEDNQITGYLAIKLNVTDYIREQEKVEFLAFHDSLTLLPNRRSLEHEMEKALKYAIRNNSFLAIFFIDLDGFKTINDALGHDVGDLLLKEVALRFRQSLRPYDEVFRIGGDEFAVLIKSNNNNDDLGQIANKLITIANKPIIIKKHTLHVGCSIGIAQYPKDGSDFVTLLKHSDTAMYKAKQDGKNMFHFYDANLSSTVHTRLNIEQALAIALDNNEFYMVYQPKYNLKDHTAISIEALIRWESASLGNVEPKDFIYIAEETTLINKIGFFVFKKACEDFAILKKKLTTLQMITINISPIQLTNKNFVNELLKITKKTKIPTSSIGLEITESNIMKNIDEVCKVLKELREHGFKIIIDDFGTGYSSMSYLQKLPIDTLKIDKSFVDDLNTTTNNTTIIKAIVAISKSFGYTTVAEGIERAEQEEFLLNLEVDYGQGFLFSKPKRVTEL